MKAPTTNSPHVDMRTGDNRCACAADGLTPAKMLRDTKDDMMAIVLFGKCGNSIVE